MSNLVECKSCKHQIDKTAKTCPNCGVANPGVKGATGCLVVFILIVAIGYIVDFVKNNTSTPAGTSTSQKIETAGSVKWKKNGMGFTATEFMSNYGDAARELNLTIDSNNLTVKDSDSGAEQITQATLSDHLALLVTADKSSGDITDVIFIGTGDGTLESGANVLAGILAAVIATNPGLSKTERGSVINALGFDSKSGQLGGTAIRNGIKYTLTQTETVGTWLTISSATASTTPIAEGTKIPADITYSIIKDESKRDIKRSVEVNLNKKVSKDVLREIALSIKQSETHPYQRTLIVYFIEGNDKTGYWATTHFNPDLDVQIIGLSAADEKTLKENTAPNPDRKIIGAWLDDRSGVEAKMTLSYTTNKAFFLETTDRYGGTRAKEMSISSYNGGERLDDKNGNAFGEYFVINATGELEFWSANGNYYTAKKI